MSHRGKIIYGSLAGFKAHCALWFWKREVVTGAKPKEAMGQFGRDHQAYLTCRPRPRSSARSRRPWPSSNRSSRTACGPQPLARGNPDGDTHRAEGVCGEFPNTAKDRERTLAALEPRVLDAPVADLVSAFAQAPLLLPAAVLLRALHLPPGAAGPLPRTGSAWPRGPVADTASRTSPCASSTVFRAGPCGRLSPGSRTSIATTSSSGARTRYGMTAASSTRTCCRSNLPNTGSATSP